jgi:hypothetical protein
MTSTPGSPIPRETGWEKREVAAIDTVARRFELTSEQAELLRHVLRRRIIRRLNKMNPGTPTQLWESIRAESAQQTAYHCRVLDRAGIVMVSETDDVEQVESLRHHYKLTELGKRIARSLREMSGAAE